MLAIMFQNPTKMWFTVLQILFLKNDEDDFLLFYLKHWNNQENI